MSEHKDVADRQRWNAFKKNYRKSNPTKIRNTQYYKHLRQLYRNRNAPTLEPWLEMPPKPCAFFVYPCHSYTEQEIIELNHSRQGRPATRGACYENLTDAEKHEVDGLKKVIKEIQQDASSDVKTKTQQTDEQIVQEMRDSYQNIQQLGEYLQFLRHESHYSPEVIAGIQREIFKLTLI